VVGWPDPEGAWPLIGALLLGYYNGDGRLVYAGRVGTGFTVEELRRVYAKLKPLVAADTGRGATAAQQPLRLTAGAGRVHWV
jgi:ATP-dependent DNA ligase